MGLMRVVAVALLLVLAACGGGGSDPAPQQSSTASASEAPTTAVPTIAAPTTSPTGKAAPEVLSDFRCEQDAAGVWNASGVLSNGTKSKATYQVTIYIGQATGGDERAKTKQVPSVAAGGSVEFTMSKIPAPKEGGPCHVQVLATK